MNQSSTEELTMLKTLLLVALIAVPPTCLFTVVWLIGKHLEQTPT